MHKVKVAEIRAGDRFGGNGTGWTAEEDAERLSSGEVSVRVRYNGDGGIGDRIWDDDSIELEVERA